MKRYSLISVCKWTNNTKNIISSDDFQFIFSRYNFILKHIKYLKKISPKTSRHRLSNYQTFEKIYKELHIKDSLYPHDILQPNYIVLFDNQTKLVISNRRFHKLMKVLIPHEITLEYLDEKKEVNKILSSQWQNYTKKYYFKYFTIC